MIYRTSGSLEIEGDILVYRITGEGLPILFIAGGGGDGDLYLPLADQLASEYKVITYDRRANAGSTINHPNNFSVEQQAKDAEAVLRQCGETSAVIFGNSSGAIIALEMLRLFPDSVRCAIIHEPPIAKVHPEQDKWLGFFRKCYNSSFGFGGSSMAAARFLFGIQVPVKQLISAQLSAEKYLKKRGIVKEKKVSSRQASRYLIQQELLPVIEYEADTDSMKREKTVLAVGDYAVNNHTFLFQIIEQLSKGTGIPYVIVPGHHGSFMDDFGTHGSTANLDRFINDRVKDANGEPLYGEACTVSGHGTLIRWTGGMVPAPTGHVSRYLPFLLILLAGLILSATIYMRRKRLS